MKIENTIVKTGKFAGKSIQEIASVEIAYITQLALISKNKTVKAAARQFINANTLSCETITDAVFSNTPTVQLKREDIDAANRQAHTAMMRNFVAKHHMKKPIKLSTKKCKEDLYINGKIACVVGYWYDFKEVILNGVSEQALMLGKAEIVIGSDSINEHFNAND
jgi:hypothetical protein